MKKETVPVSQRALIARINRALKKDDEVLKATRGERWRDEQGDFYILDWRKNWIVYKHVDLEELGRELEVLKPFEHLEVSP